MTTVSQTAQFELNNPYAKYGLKRRPTFEEIVGLISDDKRALQPLPNREATRFRNSPQGSFFDGADAMELLKEQQNRILDRQMRENIIRRQGGTHHLNMHQHNSSSSSTPALQTAREIIENEANEMVVDEAALEREMMIREVAYRERQQEISQSFGQRLRDNAMSIVSGLLPSRRPENIDIGTPSSIDEQIAQAEGGYTLTPQAQETETRLSEEDKEAIDDLPQNQKTVLFTNSFDFQKILTNNSITAEDLVFQLFFRDKYTDNIKTQLEGEPNDIKQKIFLLGIIRGLIDENEWSVDFDVKSRQQKLLRWIEYKKSNVIGSAQPSSSSSGIGQAIASGAQEGAKAVAKAVAVKGGELLIKKAFGT